MEMADRVAAAKKAYDDAMNLGAMQSDAFHAAIAAALSATEPVAWGNFKSDGTLVGLAEIKDERWTGAKPLYAAPPAPSVAVKALQMADETFRDLGWHDKYEATTAALTALSAQVQDVAGWKSTPHEPTQEMLAAAMRADQDGMSASMKTIWMVMWGASPAAPAKQEG